MPRRAFQPSRGPTSHNLASAEGELHRAATVVVKHEEFAVRVIRLPRVLHRQQVARARWPPATHLEIDCLQPLAKILERSSTARLTRARAPSAPPLRVREPPRAWSPAAAPWPRAPAAAPWPRAPRRRRPRPSPRRRRHRRRSAPLPCARSSRRRAACSRPRRRARRARPPRQTSRAAGGTPARLPRVGGRRHELAGGHAAAQHRHAGRAVVDRKRRLQDRQLRPRGSATTTGLPGTSCAAHAPRGARADRRHRRSLAPLRLRPLQLPLPVRLFRQCVVAARRAASRRWSRSRAPPASCAARRKPWRAHAPRLRCDFCQRAAARGSRAGGEGPALSTP